MVCTVHTHDTHPRSISRPLSILTSTYTPQPILLGIHGHLCILEIIQSASHQELDTTGQELQSHSHQTELGRNEILLVLV